MLTHDASRAVCLLEAVFSANFWVFPPYRTPWTDDAEVGLLDAQAPECSSMV